MKMSWYEGSVPPFTIYHDKDIEIYLQKHTLRTGVQVYTIGERAVIKKRAKKALGMATNKRNNQQ